MTVPGRSRSARQSQPLAQPFARGQGTLFRSGPFLGGYAYILTAAVLAGGQISFPHTIRSIPRHVEVLNAPAGAFPSRVSVDATASAANAVINFESAQAAGTSLWLY
jgi:hypothetical protein